MLRKRTHLASLWTWPAVIISLHVGMLTQKLDSPRIFLTIPMVKELEAHGRDQSRARKRREI